MKAYLILVLVLICVGCKKDYGNGVSSVTLKAEGNTLTSTSEITNNGEKYILISTYLALKSK